MAASTASASDDTAPCGRPRREGLRAKAKEESARLREKRAKERRAYTQSFLQEQERRFSQMASSYRERDQRWSGKLQASPYKGDLLSDHVRADDWTHVAWPAEQRAQSQVSQRERETYKTILRRALTEDDEVENLRAEKRALLESERRLKVLRDAEKTNMKIARLAHMRERENQELEMRKLAREREEQAKQDQWRLLVGYGGRPPVPRKCTSLPSIGTASNAMNSTLKDPPPTMAQVAGSTDVAPTAEASCNGLSCP